MNVLVTPEQAVAISLVMSRVIGMMLSFPLLNTTMIPTNIRVFLVVALSFSMVSIFDLSTHIEKISGLMLVLYILKELFVGFTLGLFVNFFIVALSYAAEIISYFMGLTIVNVFDPSFGQVSILNRFFVLLFYLLFFITESYRFVIGGLAMSFESIPVGTMTINQGIFAFLIDKSAAIFVLGFQIAFPFALILFVINVALALINRLIPQINVFILGMPLQIFAGLAALAAGSSMIVYFTARMLVDMGQEYLGIIKVMGG